MCKDTVKIVKSSLVPPPPIRVGAPAFGAVCHVQSLTSGGVGSGAFFLVLQITNSPYIKVHSTQSEREACQYLSFVVQGPARRGVDDFGFRYPVLTAQIPLPFVGRTPVQTPPQSQLNTWFHIPAAPVNQAPTTRAWRWRPPSGAWCVCVWKRGLREGVDRVW